MRWLAVLAIVFLAACGGEDASAPILREAPQLPSPTAIEKVRYFYDLFTSGDEVELAGKRVRIWRLVGEPGLMSQGAPALDFLLSKERNPEYHRSTNILSNVIRLLPKQPAIAGHPGFYPFLLHFLDPRNYPQTGEGGVGAETFRKTIFAIFTRFPDARAAPACIEELDRKKRETDLRPEAIVVLLKIGHFKEVQRRFKGFDQPQRLFTLVRLHEAADPKMKKEMRQVAVAFRPQLLSALDSSDAFERIYAAGTFLRLGDNAMADRLMREYATLRETREDPAWFALRILAQDRRDPRVYDLALKKAADPVASIGQQVAMELLFRYWSDESAVKKLLWSILKSTDVRKQIDLRIVNALLKVDRPAAVAYLKGLVFGDNPKRRDSALRFIRTNRTVTEAGAWLIEFLRKEPDPRRRAQYFGILTSLRTKAVVPLARAELKDSANPVAAGVVIAFNDLEGLAEVGKLVRKGNAALLEYLLQQAMTLGAAGVPEALVNDLLYALRHLSGDDSRLKVLLVLRLRARLDGVKEGLIHAYRREKSRRVAAQIETVVKELAYR